ncbi:uncharacterized protein [Apostichopus japonicus]|uniref:uncharacterized protein n=1 Tax=Stichopus japonicus TaxID=307972 RepID=UPI003AB6AFFE
MKSLYLVVAVISLLSTTDAANILFFNGLGEGSHFTVAAEIARELIHSSHSVTFLISDAYSHHKEDTIFSKLFNFEVFKHSLPLDNVRNRISGMTQAAFDDRLFMYQMTNMNRLVNETNQDCSDLLENEEIMNRLQAAKFDLTFYDPMWPCSAILADIIGAPHVALSPTAFLAAHCRLFGGETNPAFVPELGTGLPVRMSFGQRLKNTAWSLLNDALVSLFIDAPYKDLSGVPEAQRKKGVKKIMEETSLWIINSDPIIDIPVALMPNVVIAPGMSTKPAKPLDRDLEAFVQSSGDHGVIVFSLGSYVTHLPPEKQAMFVKSFGQLKQKVIWQWKGDNPPVNLPENIRTMKWIPQNDLLGHKKTRLFIYQGGNNGLYEAIYHAVPLLVLPIIGDQSDVAQRVHERGIGKRLNPITITSESLLESIREVLDTPSFQKNIDKLSEMFHDRPMTSQKKVAFIVEHLLKFGADHLRSPVHDLNFIALNMLDVYTVLLSILLLVLYITYKIIKYIVLVLISFCRPKPNKGEGSHYTTATALGEELASRGHSITFLLADVYKHRTEHPVHSKLFNFKLVKTYDSFGTECDEYEHFDLVIFDPVWPCATGVSEYLSDKRIVFLPTSLMPHMLRQLNIPINPATTSDMGLGFSSKMNFVERTANFVFVILGLITGPSLEWPYRSLMEPYGIKPSTSSLPKVDFVITATDSLIDKTIPMYPSHVAVGGISIQPVQHVLSQCDFTSLNLHALLRTNLLSKMSASLRLNVAVLIYVATILIFPKGALSFKVIFFNGKGDGSHYLAAASLGEELVARGHTVTFLLADHYMHRAQHPVHSKLFTFMPITTYPEYGPELESYMGTLFNVALEGRNILFEGKLLNAVAAAEMTYCEKVFHPVTLAALSNENFEVVIFDPIWPCATALSVYIGSKRVALMPTTLIPNFLRYMDIPINPAIVTETGLGTPSRMTFLQRVQNLLLVGLSFVWTKCYSDVTYDYIVSPHGISTSQWLSGIDFVITAADPLIDKVVPIYPRQTFAAGLTATQSKPLVKDLEEFMQSSCDHGVIVFSLGSYTTHLPEHIIMAYQTAFAKLPQKVVWQWKNKTPPKNLPSNVKTLPWLPQNDLLGHNKTKLFIYHGGNNGLYEAIYHGVPIIVMPILLDQFDVAQNVFEKEVGLKIMISELSSERVSQVIEEILTNNKYRDNMKRLSTMFRDRPQSPRETAAFWVEHVLKYGSEHLRTPGHDMSFIQYYLIDVISFLFLSVTIVLFLFYLAIKYSLKGMCLLCALTRKLKRE